MLEPTYRQTFAESWQFAWHHKITWIFGLLAGFMGSWGLNSFIAKIIFVGPVAASGTTWRMYAAIPRLFAGNGSSWFWWIAILAALVAIFVFVAAAVSQGALIASAAAWYKKKKNVALGPAWHQGAVQIWPLALLAILRKFLLGAVAVTVLSIFDAAVFHNSWLGSTAAVLLVAILFFLGLFVSTAAIFAAGYVVAGRLRFGPAVRRGASLFWEHLLVSIETSLLLLACDLALLFVISAGIFILLVPGVLFMLLAGVTGVYGLIAIGAALSAIMFVIFVAVIAGWYNAFITSIWMYLFMKMHHEGVASRVVHYLGRALGRS